MDLEQFINLNSSEVAAEMRRANSTVCAFPINGTRRWFMLEHPTASETEYMDAIVKRHVDLYRLLFENGIDTILAPIFEPSMLMRGDDYQKNYVERGLPLVATHPIFTDFYGDDQVRVLFYGDYRKFFTNTNNTEILEKFDYIVQKTQENNRFRLFFGVCTRRAMDTIGELSVQRYLKQGQVPGQQSLIEMYYGEHINRVSLFVTSGKTNVFGMPFLDTDDTSLYFTIAPSLYLTKRQLRAILYDHLFNRQTLAKKDYTDLTSDDIENMRSFYRQNIKSCMGVGVLQKGTWYPIPLD